MRPQVLFMSASYPTPDARTNGIFVREHARAAAIYADVAVVHLHRDRSFRVDRVSGEELLTWRVSYPRRPLALSYAANLAAAVAGFRAARSAGFRPDLIHANFFLAAVPAVIVAAPLRLPVVTSEHWSVFLPGDPMELGRLNTSLARFAFRRSAVVLPVSGALRDAIASLGADRFAHVVPNAVDTDLFHPSRERADSAEVRLLAVSGLYGAKGYEYLLPAVAELVRRGVAVRLQIAGDGEGRSRYEQIAAELELGSVVRFLGERSKSDVAELMREADLFVLGSVYENNPCAVLEALVSGLPVVATDVGGVPEAVRRGRGLLARPRDVHDLAAKIEQALDERFDRDAIARGAAAEYGLEAIGEALAAVYERVLA